MEKNKKILVCDDDKDLCDLICEIFMDEGFEVSKAYDGNIALSMLMNEQFDIMIIDNKLGGMSGISVIEKTVCFNPDLNKLMISAYGNAETKEKAKNIGVKEFIDKPFVISKLVESVKNIVTPSKATVSPKL